MANARLLRLTAILDKAATGAWQDLTGKSE